MASGFAKDNTSINWNLENEYSSLSRMQKPEKILTSTGGRSKNQITSLRMGQMEDLIGGSRNPNMMSNIPELANESRFSDNFSQGEILAYLTEGYTKSNFNANNHASRYSKAIVGTMNSEPQRLPYGSEVPRRDKKGMHSAKFTAKDPKSMTLDEWEGQINSKSKKRMSKF